ncbi:MFS general substrate transporter [Lindgomyces ingoldianus]|uniref:MFS general substrate transporter n=1 Tax=Lindgomyces ingoldianus TaxID=673940 RepID=A0ACB6RDX1_9PLEO|nr:MFS general substrate transporter [Lindgomyces ingoldianus]KAF2477341.1 MFS general substrate transporter [Lindgomyces ingoldianus]
MADLKSTVSKLSSIPRLDAIYEKDTVGYKEYREGLDIEFTEKEACIPFHNTRLRWTIDIVFMDKTAMNYVNLFGHQKALGLYGRLFNCLSAMVYAGYLFGQYPCGWLIGRFPAQRVIGISCLLWGAMVLILTQCRSYSSALAVWLFMDVFEAAFTPGLTLMAGFWYTRREIPLRHGINGSYISMDVSKLPLTMKPERWELIFLILGGATCLWAFVVYFFLPDAPSNAWFLPERERILASKRVSGNEIGIKSKGFNTKQAIVAFWDPKALLPFTSVFAAAIPNGQQWQISSAPSRLHAPHTSHDLIPGDTLSRSSSSTVSVGFTVSLGRISSNMAGYTHRTMASAMIFTVYCWGNFVAGSFVVKESEAPEHRGATIGLLVGYTIKLACHLGLLTYVFFMNRHRNRKYGPADKTRSDEAGMLDVTEFDNKDFGHVL